jgi:hypothetical protein
MIDLAGAILLGQGNERLCYVHPADPAQVIKVQRPGGRTRGQNRIEHAYLTALVRRGAPFEHIPRLHGWVATSAGEGLACERIVNADGTAPLALAAAVGGGQLSRAQADGLLAGLLDHLLRHWIVFADVGGGNVVCQRTATGPRLMIIDGLGARHPGAKLWLHGHLPWLARAKVRKQWPKLLANLWTPSRPA